ncbi:MAG: hypothetical protein IJZ13_02830, partial [Clostridia bacterium]|nr:hypothetical protein [Clostridia bacterium]
MNRYRVKWMLGAFLRRTAVLLLVVCLLVGLLACGKGDSPASSAPDTENTASSTSGGESTTASGGGESDTTAGTETDASVSVPGSTASSKTVSGTKKTTATTARTTTKAKPVDVTGTVKVPAEGGYATGGDTNNPGHQKAICQTFKSGNIQKLNKLKVTYDDSLANSGSIKTGYLLEEEFMGWGLTEGLVVNGWDVDDAGGGVCSSVYSHFNLVDNSSGKSVTMKREFTQLTSGTFAVEISTGVSGKEMGDTWFSFNNDGKTVFSFGFATDGNMAVKTDAGAETVLCKYRDDVNYGVKITGDMAAGKLSVWIDGICYAADVAFSGRRLDNLQVKTSAGGKGVLCLNYIGIYKGYIYNENFIAALSGYVPDDWQVTGEESASVAILESETRPNVFSLLLNDDTGTKNVSLYRPFTKTAGDIQVDFKFYAPEEGKDGLVFRLMNGKNTAFCLFVQYGSLYAQDKDGKVYRLYKLTSNVWYTVQVEVDASAKTAEVRLNYKTRASGLKIGADTFDGISFATTKLQLSTVYLDDIQVAPVYSLPADYVPKPAKADNGGYDIGVLRCDLWKTGDHLGWDYLNGLEDNVRLPITGWYDDGNPELADWENKYMAEHGIDFFLSCWYGPYAGSTGSGKAIKSPLHGESLHNGYFNSQYSDMVDFAIVVAFEFTGLEDWKENIVPFMVEYYLKDDRYKVIDNRPVIVFHYYDMLLRSFGSENNLKVGLAYLRQACKKLGYDDAYLLIETPALAKENNVEANRLGLFDYSCAYAMSSLSNSPSTMLAGNVDTQKYDGAEGLIASVSVGFDYEPWDKSNNNPL